MLGFVSGTAGKYTVADGYDVKAFSSEDDELVAESNDGLLDLTANGSGEYYVICTAQKDITVDDELGNNDYDIRDLVAASMYVDDNTSVEINITVADKDSDGDIDKDDIAIIRWELLTNKTYIPETESNEEAQVTTLSAVDAIDKTSLLAVYSVKKQYKLYM